MHARRNASASGVGGGAATRKAHTRSTLQFSDSFDSEAQRSTTSSREHDGPRACVAIPCAAKHVPYLNEAVKSVATQTMRPAMIAVYVSGVFACPRPPTYGVPLRISCSAKPEGAGPARNLAVALCDNRQQFISFLDADDVMLPYGLQRMVQLMMENNASVGLHDYIRKDEPTLVRNHNEMVGQFQQRVPPLSLPTHLGHVTVRRQALIPLRHTPGKEDSMFVLDLFNRNATFVHTIEPLTRYMNRIKRNTRQTAPPPRLGARDYRSRMTPANRPNGAAQRHSARPSWLSRLLGFG